LIEKNLVELNNKNQDDILGGLQRYDVGLIQAFLANNCGKTNKIQYHEYGVRVNRNNKGIEA
jgi:hypothetical protein